MIFFFKKSSFSNGSSACVDVGIPTNWRKSPYSQGNGNCVEIGDLSGGVAVRDTKLGDDSPILRFTDSEWIAFTRAIKDGQFD